MPRSFTGLDAATVRANAEEVRDRIAKAAERANRDPADVDLLAAVKYVPLEELHVLAQAGLTLVGENRAQNFPELRWHFIGQLQSRKVKLIVPHAQLIHSVDSESALEQLGRHATPDTEILVQVNVAREPNKGGVLPDDLPDFLQQSPVPVVGLATMPPFTDDPESSRPHFKALRELARANGLHHLSMGTSQDFETAVEEGATIVRLGAILYAT
jgi:pyridoxal phosphate enzyme (YggS family)